MWFIKLLARASSFSWKLGAGSPGYSSTPIHMTSLRLCPQQPPMMQLHYLTSSSLSLTASIHIAALCSCFIQHICIIRIVLMSRIWIWALNTRLWNILAVVTQILNTVHVRDCHHHSSAVTAEPTPAYSMCHPIVHPWLFSHVSFSPPSCNAIWWYPKSDEKGIVHACEALLAWSWPWHPCSALLCLSFCCPHFTSFKVPGEDKEGILLLEVRRYQQLLIMLAHSCSVPVGGLDGHGNPECPLQDLIDPSWHAVSPLFSSLRTQNRLQQGTLQYPLPHYEACHSWHMVISTTSFPL